MRLKLTYLYLVTLSQREVAKQVECCRPKTCFWGWKEFGVGQLESAEISRE